MFGSPRRARGVLIYALRVSQYQPDVEDIMSTLDPQGQGVGNGRCGHRRQWHRGGPRAGSHGGGGVARRHPGVFIGRRRPRQISDIMLDVGSGRIAYAVLSEGGFLGMGANLHAILWNV